MSQHMGKFEENDIQGSVLPQLDHTTLKEMGITSVGERLRLLGAIRLLNRHTPTDSLRTMSLSPQLSSHPIPSPSTPVHSYSVIPTSASTGSYVNLPSASQSYNQIPLSPPIRTMSPIQLTPMTLAPAPASMSTSRPSSADSMNNLEVPTNGRNQSMRRPSTASGASNHSIPTRPLSSHGRGPSTNIKPLDPVTMPSSNQSQQAGYAVGRGAFVNKPRVGQISAPYNLRRTELDPDDSLRSEVSTVNATPQSLEVIRKHIIKFLAEDGTSRSVDVSQCKQASDVLAKVLRKFGRLTEPDSTQYMRRWVLAMTDAGDQLKVLSEIELMALCSQPHNYEPVWRHGLYLLRTTDEEPLRPGSKREAPVDAFRHLPITRRASTFSILNGLGGGELSEIESLPADSATRSKAKPADMSGHLPNVRRRVRNFFGQRPSSELISSHLAEYFPATNSNELRRYSKGSSKKRVSVPMTPYAPRSNVQPSGPDIESDPTDDHASLVTLDEITQDLERASVHDTGENDSGRWSNPSSAPLPVPTDTVSATQMLPPTVTTPSVSPELTAPLTDGTFAPSGAPATKQHMRWHKGALIGTGSFGKVFLGMNAKTGMLMAVKQVELPHSDDEMTRHRRMMIESLESEIVLLKSIQHPNIVQYLDSFADDKHLNIFLEYVPGGSVVALLQSYGAFEEALVQNFVRQILRGLSFLHARDIVHRDIKGANILVDNKGGVKISDFGISKKVESGLLFAGPTGGKSRPAIQGSVFWMAPEVVKQTAFTAKADVWSLGCCVVEMFTATHPWPQLDQMQALFQIGMNKTPALPPDISEVAASFLNATFELNHADRPSADELLRHAFVLQATNDGEMDGSEPS